MSSAATVRKRDETSSPQPGGCGAGVRADPRRGDSHPRSTSCRARRVPICRRHGMVSPSGEDVRRALDFRKIKIDDELSPDRTGAQLRGREVEINFVLHVVVGELVAGRHAHAAGRALRVDEVDARDLAFFAAVVCKCGNVQRLIGHAEDVPVALVKPLRLHADRSCRRCPTGTAAWNR